MYVDGFVLPVPSARLEDYRAHAEAALAVWMDHGALAAWECAGDDVPEGEVTSFPMAVKLEPGETVVFSFILYRDRTHRDAVNAAVFEDPRMEAMKPGNGADLPFDGRRMIWGGFRPIVRLGASG